MEEGFAYSPQIPPNYFPVPPWIADGYTMSTSCIYGFYVVGFESWQGPGTPDNFHILSTGGDYEARFIGKATYFTDE